MIQIKSDTVVIEKSAEQVFNFLSNFNNFQALMPPQVINWQSTEDACSFSVTGMAGIGMKIIEKIPHSKILITSDGKMPFGFTLTAHIEACSENGCNGRLVLEAELNRMMTMMVEKPLTNFVNQLAQKLKDI
jgi:hypothetical protein